MSKDYIFPCGEKITTKTDAGYAYGLLVGQKDKDADESTRVWCDEGCKQCKRNCVIQRTASYMNRDTHKESVKSDLVCLAYSQEYLDNKDRPTVSYLDDYPEGEYVIEITLQAGEYRTVYYKRGLTCGCGLLDLVDEDSLEEFFADNYNEDLDGYYIWMTDDEGRTIDIEFDSINEIVNSVTSVRLIELKDEQQG